MFRLTTQLLKKSSSFTKFPLWQRSLGSLTQQQPYLPHSGDYLETQKKALNADKIEEIKIAKGKLVVGLTHNSDQLLYGATPVHEETILQSVQGLAYLFKQNQKNGGSIAVYEIKDEVTCIKVDKTDIYNPLYIHPSKMTLQKRLGDVEELESSTLPSSIW